jgi:hypothetical protein
MFDSIRTPKINCIWILLALVLQSIWCAPTGPEENDLAPTSTQSKVRHITNLLILNRSEAFSNDIMDLIQQMVDGPSRDNYELVQFVLRENRFETMKMFPDVIRYLSKDDSSVKALKKLMDYPYLIYDKRISFPNKPDLYNVKKNPPFLVSREQLSTIVSEMLASDQVSPNVGRFWIQQAFKDKIKPSKETLFEWSCRNGILDQVIQITHWHLRPATEEFWGLGFLTAVKYSQAKVAKYLLQNDVASIYGIPDGIYLFMAQSHAYFSDVPKDVHDVLSRYTLTSDPKLWTLPDRQNGRSMEDLIYDAAKQWDKYDLFQIRSTLVFTCRFGHSRLFQKLLSLRSFANDLAVSPDFFQFLVEESITYKSGMMQLVVETIEPILSAKGTKPLITSFQGLLYGLKSEPGVARDFQFLANYGMEKGYIVDVVGITDIRNVPALTEAMKWMVLELTPQRSMHLAMRDVLLTGEWLFAEELAKRMDKNNFRMGLDLAFKALLGKEGLNRFLLDGLASMVLYTSVVSDEDRRVIYRKMILMALQKGNALAFRRLVFHLSLSVSERDLIVELVGLLESKKMAEMGIDLNVFKKELQGLPFIPKGLTDKMSRVQVGSSGLVKFT